MIAKEKTTPVPKDKLGKAGHDAEKQMAFYLRRAFGDAPDVLIFNDLRLERGGEVAQIDHLVLHRFGFAIVESKSVVGELAVNQHGEFTRIWGRKREGMQSPIKQAGLQAEILSKLLNDHKEILRRKVLFGMKQAEFGEKRFQVFAAISDSGRITRENCDPEELCKADSVAEKIKAIIDSKTKLTGWGGNFRLMTAGSKASNQMIEDYLNPLTDEELTGIKDFLLEQDTPRFAAPAAQVVKAEVAAPKVKAAKSVSPPPIAENLRTVHMPAPAATPPPRQKPVPPVAAPVETASPPALNTAQCKQCSGSKLKILHGRYGYYYKCSACDGNTPIDLTCTNCSEKAKVTKSKLEFSRDCVKCGEKVLFHVNAAV